MIVGMIKTEAGKILIDDSDITSKPIHQRFEYGISYLPQEPSIFRDMTTIDNINAILETDISMNATDRKKRLDELITKFGLKKFLNTKGLQLSGGERRMLEISIFKPLFMDPSPCQSYWQCKHWPGDNVLWDRMIAMSDRFAFRKHRISLSRLHKCSACEMCGFIFHICIRSSIIVIRNVFK